MAKPSRAKRKKARQATEPGAGPVERDGSGSRSASTRGGSAQHGSGQHRSEKRRSEKRRSAPHRGARRGPAKGSGASGSPSHAASPAGLPTIAKVGIGVVIILAVMYVLSELRRG